MKRQVSALVVVLVLGMFGAMLVPPASADNLASYAALGYAGVTNTGTSLIYGDVGGGSGSTAVTGFPPGIVESPYTILTGSGTNFSDATTAYTTALSLTGTDLTGDTLGVGVANNLVPGVYNFSSSAPLNGALILNAGGSDSASWTFVIGSTLKSASGSSVEVVNAGANGPFDGSITWVTVAGATLGTTTTFLGTIISEAGDTLNTGATIGCGSVISLGASVTLDDNVINTPADCMVTGAIGGTGGTIGPPSPPPIVTPEPDTLALLSSGLLAMVFLAFTRRA